MNELSKDKIFNSVNVFQGTRGSVKPEKGSLFSRWNLLKGKAGNTSPSACLPFGNVSCSPYSGGYSSGYGNFKRNGGEEPEIFFDGKKLIGFSHFTHSGSGAFGLYYNYLLTIPFRNELKDIHRLKEIDNEYATPGYYSCRMVQDNIVSELTVSNQVAIHRYTSLDGNPFKLAIDISNDGLKQPWDEKVFDYSQQSEISVLDGNVVGYVVMQGVKLYFCIKALDNALLWLNEKIILDNQMKLDKSKNTFGCLFNVDKKSVVIKIGFSFESIDKAKIAVLTSPGFDEAKKNAEIIWKNRLSTIEVDGVSKTDKEVFYSNYYHSMIKPCAWNKESFLWNEDDVFYCDFATLWDVYKTQMPLIFTLHKGVAKGVVKTILRYGKEKGKLFNALLLSANMNIESTQACCLGCYVLYDAYVRKMISSEDFDDMLSVVKADIEQYEQGIKQGSFDKTTKLLDCTLIAQAFAKISKDAGRIDYYEYFTEISKYWVNAFDSDGLLKPEYEYYEGNRWNYSFRFINDVKKRIELSGGKENLIKQLDAFFAFNDANSVDDRFEGFNNETDMETPYFYHYVGRYDRISQIMQECVQNCFKTGRDGLPGNNDSGGLSACYIWNFLGLFPISGNDSMFLGVPKAKKAILHLANGKDLVIVSNVKNGLVDKISFNGQVVNDYKISVNKLFNGGELVFS